MEKELPKKNVRKYTPYFIIAVIIVLTVLIKNIISTELRKKQESIHITPEQIIKEFQDSGYLVENITHVTNYEAGYLGLIKDGVLFSITDHDDTFGVMMDKVESWEEARREVKLINNLSTNQDGVFGYAFYYGDIFVHVDNKIFGDGLLKIINEIDNKN